MTTHCTDRLSEYLDGELPPAEQQAVAAHLRGCPACAADLEALRTMVAAARALPREQPLARDSWAQVHARLAPRRMAVARVRPWRVTLSLPQLAAAAALLVALGMGGMWLQMRQAAGGPAAGVAGRTDAAAVLPAALGDDSYETVVTDLEAALESGRGRLDPATVRVLEENLAAIDAAIVQAREALAADPANVGLTRHLLRTRAMRVTLLRRAVAATAQGAGDRG